MVYQKETFNSKSLTQANATTPESHASYDAHIHVSKKHLRNAFAAGISACNLPDANPHVCLSKSPSCMKPQALYA